VMEKQHFSRQVLNAMSRFCRIDILNLRHKSLS